MTTAPAPLGRPDVPGYELGDLLGRGAAGTVWSATRDLDGGAVAVKVVPVGDPDQVRVLARELAVLSRVEVDGLVRFHEAIGLVGERPAVAIVLDHLAGGSVEQAVAARGHLSAGESVTVLAPVARALAGLHGLGVVHGDVAPGNVLLAQSGQPFLADLGVARLAGERPGILWGTPGFVAPEVLDLGQLTTAADVYAVGALAWWCVTGRAPEPAAIRPPLEELAPGLPPAWSEVTKQALVGDPALRPTAAELALAYYDSAPCEPLRLVVGRDETSLLTQRLRRPTVAPAGPPEPGRRRRVRRRTPLTAAVPATRRALAGATVAALVAGLGYGGLVIGDVVARPPWLGARPSASAPARPTGPTAESSRGDAAAATARGASPSTAVTNAPAARGLPARPVDTTVDAAADPRAPDRDALLLATALARVRSEAMNTGSARLLARLDAPGSSALAEDLALLTGLTRAGTSWRDVRLDVSAARTVTRGRASATVEAVVGTAAYRVVEAGGRVVTRPAVPARRLLLDLVWSGGRWRVEGVSEPDGAGSTR